MKVSALEGLDLQTYEGRTEAFRRYFDPSSETNDVATLKPEFVEYRKDDTLIVRFRPQEWQLNGMRYVQGGFLVSMIDVVCGPMAAVYADSKPSGTVNLAVDFFRPVTLEDESVTVVAHIANNTRRLTHIEAELCTNSGKIAVKMSTNVIKDNR